MTTCLFVGPTLPPSEITARCDFACLPPAAMGDVYRAAAARPRAIGIIDGYFEGVPAVWHKEILWAMTQGVHVFGSASMGALRAAELQAFGMRGVGRIFEAYRSGEIEDDDEVAVVHGPAETGYVALSEPMVNIRATLAQAEAEGVIGPPARVELLERAKSLFYQDRSWERLLAGPASEESSRLRDWLPAGRIDQKRRDAFEMIAAMQEFLAADPAPMQPDFAFEWTDMWDIASEAMAKGGRGRGDVGEDRVLDELRLDAAFETTRQRALLRHLARHGGRLRPGNVDLATHRKAEQELRLRLGLLRRADIERWCAENELASTDFARLIEDEARLAAIDTSIDAALTRDLLDQSRLDGDYGRLLARARDKRVVLAAGGPEDVTPEDCGLTPIALVAWYFERRLARLIPDDLHAYARRLGLPQLADFYRLLAREWLYSRRGQVGTDR
ncbi:MAG: TfuA-like protein [Dongiaceae bacterium]